MKKSLITKLDNEKPTDNRKPDSHTVSYVTHRGSGHHDPGHFYSSNSSGGSSVPHAYFSSSNSSASISYSSSSNSSEKYFSTKKNSENSYQNANDLTSVVNENYKVVSEETPENNYSVSPRKKLKSKGVMHAFKNAFIGGLMLTSLAACGGRKLVGPVGPQPPITQNNPPVLVSNPPTSVDAGKTMNYQIEVNPNGGTIQSYFVKNLKGVKVSTTGGVSYTAPSLAVSKKDSTINNILYGAIVKETSSKIDTLKQPSNLTIKYVPPALPQANFSKDFVGGIGEMTKKTLSLEQIAKNSGDSIKVTNVQDLNSWFSTLSVGPKNQLTMESKPVSQDEVANLKIFYKDLKTGETNSTTVKDTIWNYLNVTGGVQSILNHGTDVSAVIEMGYIDNSGKYVALKKFSPLNGGTVEKDSKGGIAVTTGANNQFNFQVRDMRADSLGGKELILQGVAGQLTTYNGSLTSAVGSPAGTGSDSRLVKITLTKDPSDNQTSKILWRVTPYGTIMGPNGELSAAGFNNLFSNLNGAHNNGNLVKSDINKIIFISNNNGNVLSPSVIDGGKYFVSEMDSVLKSHGEKGSVSYEISSTLTGVHYDATYGGYVPDSAGTQIIMDVPNNDKVLYNPNVSNKYGLSSTDNSFRKNAVITGAVTYISNDVGRTNTGFPVYSIIGHEILLGQEPNELDKTWANKSIFSSATTCTSMKPIDSFIFYLSKSSNYPANENELYFLSPVINLQDFMSVSSAKTPLNITAQVANGFNKYYSAGN